MDDDRTTHAAEQTGNTAEAELSDSELERVAGGAPTGNINALQPPGGLSASWLAMNGISPSQATSQAAILQRLTDALNQVPNTDLKKPPTT